MYPYKILYAACLKDEQWSDAVVVGAYATPYTVVLDTLLTIEHLRILYCHAQHYFPYPHNIWEFPVPLHIYEVLVPYRDILVSAQFLENVKKQYFFFSTKENK